MKGLSEPDNRKFARVFWRDVLVMVLVTMFTALGLWIFYYATVG